MSRFLSPGGGLGLALIATAPASGILALQSARGNGWLFNDFYAYWLAGRLVARGHNPYDLAAFADLARSEGIPSVVGGGYSYPPLFAVLMVPLATLPFGAAAWLFATGSALAFGVTVAGLVRATPALACGTWPRRAACALAMGAYPPIASSLFIGQVNLLVLGLLAFGLVGGRSMPRLLSGGLAFGLAASIKMVPGVLLVPLLLARRWAVAAGMLMAMIASLAWSRVVAPEAVRGVGGLAALFESDAYWTNQSLNGFASRLFLDSDRTRAVLADSAFIPYVSIALTALLALATGHTLWRARRALGGCTRALDLALALVLVAATAGAQKTSFNNHAPALLAVWILVARSAAGFGGLQPIERWLLGGWVAGAAMWAVSEAIQDPFDGALGILRTLVTSSSLYGLLGLWIVLCRQLLRLVPRPTGSY